MEVDTQHHLSNISGPLPEKKMQLGSNQCASIHKLRIQFSCTLQIYQFHKGKNKVGEVLNSQGT